jgi:LPXTG-site transpeptidase (sortase) family protein
LISNQRKKLSVSIAAFVIIILAFLSIWKSFSDPFGDKSGLQSSVLAPQTEPGVEAPLLSTQGLPIIATVTADSAGIAKLPVTPGTSDEILDTGLAGAYPWSGPGKPGVFSISAHRVGAGGPFLNLDKMKTDDSITVTDDNGMEFSYRVTSIEIVEPDDISVLKGPKDESRLVLITCTPIETYADRLVVTAVLEN